MKDKDAALELPKLAYSIPDVCRVVGIKSPKTIYEEINSGRLRSFNVGRRHMVSAQAISDWIKAQEARTQPHA